MENRPFFRAAMAGLGCKGLNGLSVTTPWGEGSSKNKL